MMGIRGSRTHDEGHTTRLNQGHKTMTNGGQRPDTQQ